MFERMLTVHCDQNDSYEIAINGFQVRKIKEIRNVSYFVYFFDLKTIYSYFITIILIKMNSQYSYKHFVSQITPGNDPQ